MPPISPHPYHRIKASFITSVALLIVGAMVGGWVLFRGALNRSLGLGTNGSNLASTATETPVLKSKANAHILMYHYVRDGVDEATDPIGYRLSTPPEVLDEQITLLQAMGYKPATMKDVAEGKGGKRTVVLTFDDGYLDFYTKAYPILKEHGWTATVYVVSGFIGRAGYLTRGQIKELHDNGLEIGVHSVNHFDLAKMTPERAAQEITQSKTAIEKITGEPTYTFAYPAGKYNEDTMRLVEQAGLTSAVTTNSGVAAPHNSAFELPRIRIEPKITLIDLQQLMQ